MPHDSNTEAREAILEYLQERCDLYLAHCRDRSSTTSCRFYPPFKSPVELFAAVSAELPFLSAVDFTLTVTSLVGEGLVCRVVEETYSLESPCDFREASIGDLFLNVPQLVAAYGVSVRHAKERLEVVSGY
jgi:hypothetical protein